MLGRIRPDDDSVVESSTGAVRAVLGARSSGSLPGGESTPSPICARAARRRRRAARVGRHLLHRVEGLCEERQHVQLRSQSLLLERRFDCAFGLMDRSWVETGSGLATPSPRASHDSRPSLFRFSLAPTVRLGVPFGRLVRHGRVRVTASHDVVGFIADAADAVQLPLRSGSPPSSGSNSRVSSR